MKSPTSQIVEDDCDDIFGPPRTYPTGYCPPKNRPSMISAKYRQKEERRKVLKISMNKLKKIEDPESSLCRSVLINNTMKRLQQEARDEKIQKQQLNYPRCFDNDNLLNIKSEFIKNEAKSASPNATQQTVPGATTPYDEFVVENDFDAKLAEEINTMAAKNMEVFSDLVDESNLVVSESSQQTAEQMLCNDNNSSSNDSFGTGRKRTFDEMEDCDVQDVLSQFYMPPTPRMLTCIDEDDVEENTATVKRCKLEQEVEEKSSGDFSVNFLNNNLPVRYGNNASSDTTDTNNSFSSCGHASMFNELQNNVYHNLIASLET